jgi:hypothetical protein
MGAGRGWARRASCLLLTGVTAITPTAETTAPIPAVVGPVTGGNGAIVLLGTSFDLADLGYTQSEFFLSGTATSYIAAAGLGAAGQWQVTPADAAPYTTRVVTYRPADPARFNGTVIVEWLNVSSGLDAAPDWILSHNELIRDGFAWVGVSAQADGVNADKTTDPVRYADLSHPGDSFSYDIFSQAGRAVREQAATVLGGLSPQHVLAEGQSQSAFRLTTYINAVHPLAAVYDGYLVHSRAAGSAALSQAPQADVSTPAIVRLRTDLDVPVLDTQTESDVLGLTSVLARQSDSTNYRLWEMAGTAHADDYTAVVGPTDDETGAAAGQQFADMLAPPYGAPGHTCDSPINTGQMHYVLDAAQYALNRWVSTGVAPTSAPRLEVTTAGDTTTFVLDANGNVKGGVRTPAVDVPVATLSGLGQTGLELCFLFGTTTPFDAETLATLYSDNEQFVASWTAATQAGVAAGYILPADAAELVSAAVGSGVPSG